jgi:hypothetical protein
MPCPQREGNNNTLLHATPLSLKIKMLPSKRVQGEMIARGLDSEAAGCSEHSIPSDSGVLCILPVALVKSTQLFEITLITMNEFFYVNILSF